MKRKLCLVIMAVVLVLGVAVAFSGCEGGYTPNGIMWFTGQKG